MAIIINIDHSTGNLTQYTDTTTDGGDLSVTVGAALASTNYGLNVLIDDTNTKRGEFDFTKVGTLRLRYYFDLNTISMTDGAGFVMTQITQNGGGYGVISQISAEYNIATGYRIYFWVKNDAGAATVLDQLDITDVPHYVEFKVVRAATDISADGTAQWWVDGIDQGSFTNIDNYNNMYDADFHLRVGAEQFGGTSVGTIFIDEIKANDDGSLIGPLTTNATTLITRKTLLGVGI
jgi:hypothetical protein